ncbi:LuxR C-terminal-related transcriptional regulator [Paraburkholderia sp. GAS348]|uniref:LuxR C-terminal-related transcriptional regulator n=1 Tax=Paraburkholderia sp. GAS348 TaxID=3035132 RepID=UPI003D24093B
MSNEALRADIDRRRAAQTLSAESREKYHALFRHLPPGLLVCDASGDITEANRTFQQYLGANTRAALEQGLSDPTRVIKADGHRTSISDLLRGHLPGTSRRVARFDIGLIARNGERRDLAVVVAPMSGRGFGVTFAFSDVTEQRRAREREHAQQAALTHASRLSLKGQMTSASANELGQPLSACQCYLSGLRHRIAGELPDQPELAAALDKAIALMDQAGQIIRNRIARIARERYATRLRTHSLKEQLARLSGREREVLDGLLDGRTSKEIARVLNISPKTVDVHRTNVIRKMMVSSGAELVRSLRALRRE